jgi:hypothetical protein
MERSTLSALIVVVGSLIATILTARSARGKKQEEDGRLRKESSRKKPDVEN